MCPLFSLNTTIQHSVGTKGPQSQSCDLWATVDLVQGSTRNKSLGIQDSREWQEYSAALRFWTHREAGLHRETGLQENFTTGGLVSQQGAASVKQRL